MSSYNKNIIVYNSLNNWWSYQLTLESYFRNKSLYENVQWINIAEKNIKKYELNAFDYLSPLIYKNPIKNLKKIKDQFDLNLHLDYLECKKRIKPLKFRSIKELKNFYLDDYNLGGLVYTQICGTLQTTNFDVIKYRKLINYHINIGINVYEKVIEDIKKNKPDQIIVINDRIIGSAAAITAAKSLNTNYSVIYWGSSINRYVEYKDSLYSFSSRKEKINVDWKSAKYSERDKIRLAAELKNELSKMSVDSRDFQKRVNAGTRYDKKSNLKLAVFFAGSEWEHSFIKDRNFMEHSFNNEQTSFTEVARQLIEMKWEVVLKLHPLRNLHSNNKIEQEWDEILNLPGISVIKKDSNVDTYELVKQADLNIVFGSTVGLECISRGLPVMILGDPDWACNIQSARVKDLNDAMHYIKKEKFKVELEEMLPWYHYSKNHGEKFIFIETTDFKTKFREFGIITYRWYMNSLIFLRKKILTIKK